jgi:hypothetical protein
VRSAPPTQDDDLAIAVSPRHTVRLTHDYAPMIRHAPREDFVVRTIASRYANDMPLMSADLVIASEDTRQRFPAARTYPLHFRKRYYPGRLHGDPKLEFDRQSEAATLVGIPPPIGYSSDIFRSCLVPGLPYSRLSPFGAEPEESNIARAEELELAAAAGLWRMAEAAFTQLITMHAGGLAHGDAELHNFIVCPSPLEVVMIDFEVAERQDDASTDANWQTICSKDLTPLLREAVLLQCCLGPQPGRLAELARERIDTAFKNPDRFRLELDRRATPSA